MAECAIPHAVALAELSQAEVYLLHVMTDGQENEHVDPMQWYLRKAAVQAYMDTLCAKLETLGIQPTCLVLAGTPAERIIDQIERWDIDLVIVSAHGESDSRDGPLGAVAYKLLENVGVSTMLLQDTLLQDAERQIEPARYSKLFVPLDGSRRAECVLPIAEQLLAAHGATLILGHVVQRPAMLGWSMLQDADRKSTEALVERAQCHVEAYLADIKARWGENAMTVQALADNTAMELSRMLEQQTADLLLLSAHGAASNPRRTFGDTLRSLITYTHVPILIYQDQPVMRPHAELEAPKRNTHENSFDLDI